MKNMGPWLYRGVWELPNLYGDLYHKSWHFQDPHETRENPPKPRLVELTEVGAGLVFWGMKHYTW